VVYWGEFAAVLRQIARASSGKLSIQIDVKNLSDVSSGGCPEGLMANSWSMLVFFKKANYYEQAIRHRQLCP